MHVCKGPHLDAPTGRVCLIRWRAFKWAQYIRGPFCFSYTSLQTLWHFPSTETFPKTFLKIIFARHLELSFESDHVRTNSASCPLSMCRPNAHQSRGRGGGLLRERGLSQKVSSHLVNNIAIRTNSCLYLLCICIFTIPRANASLL